MKETVRSMSTYFVIAGVLILIGNGSSLAEPNLPMLSKVLAGITLLLGVTFLYAGATLKAAISTGNTSIIRTIILANLIWNTMIYTLAIIGSQSSTLIIRLLITLGIGFYLLINLKRLAEQPKEQPTEQPTE